MQSAPQQAILLLSTSERDNFFHANMQLCHLHYYYFFCFGFTSSSSSFRCLSCVPLRFSIASVSHFRCFCVVSFLLIVFYGVFSCSCGYFFQSLFQPTLMTFNSTCLLFFFHLCLKFLARHMFLSLTASSQTLNLKNYNNV